MRRGAGAHGGRRLLFVAESLEVGGAERVVTHLLRGLPPARFDLHLALLSAAGPLLDALPRSVTLHDLGGRRARAAGPPLVRLIWRLRPDVVVSSTYTVSLLLMGLRRLLPPLVLIPRVSNLARAGFGSFHPESVWMPVVRVLCRQATRFVCPAAALVPDLERNLGIRTERIVHIPNPVDTREIAQRAEEPSPYAGPGPHLVAIGRLIPQKGIDRLIAVLPRLGNRECRLSILGAGNAEASLRAAAAAAGVESRVRFRGFVANPYAWLRHADLFVQGSRFEGCPNALLEALACGTRAVAFDSPGGTREILDGSPGTALVPDGDATAFAAAVDRMLSPSPPPRPSLHPRHAYDTVVRQYQQLFDNPTAGPRPPGPR